MSTFQTPSGHSNIEQYEPENLTEEVSGDTQVSGIESTDMTPIPVRVIGGERERRARYRSTQTVNTLNAADLVPIQQILPQASKRHRAVISSRPLLTGEASAEFVLIGSREQVMNAQGYRLWNGEIRTIESTSSMFIGPGTNPPTHTVSISIIDERHE